MKKILSVLATTAAAAMSAQTITQATHEPAISDVEYIVTLDTSGFSSGMPLTVTGANSVWDFSSGVPGTNTLSNTYDAPGTYTHGTLFSGATIVQNLIGTMWNYVKATSTPTTQSEIVGIYTSTLALTFTNSAIMIQYPASLGFSLNDPASGTFTFSSFNGPFDGTSQTMADGTGTLIMPGGITHTNVLRVKCTQVFTLDAGITTGTLTQNIYNYYDPGKKFPLLNISYIHVATGVGAPMMIAGAFASTDALVPVGLSASGPLTGSSVYPNPVSGQLFIEGTSGILDIFNLHGQKMISFENPVGTVSTIDVSSWPAGLYTIRALNNGVAEAKKLVVIH